MTRKTRGHIYEKWAALGYDTEDITKSVIIGALEARKETPDQANLILTALKNLFAWAVSVGHVDRNPCEGIKGRKPKKAGVDEEDGHKTWSEEELAQFERAYPLGSHERLVYSVLLYTGLRIGDAARLGRQHIQKDGTIQLRNEKTGAVVYLPILAPLRQALWPGRLHGARDSQGRRSTARRGGRDRQSVDGDLRLDPSRYGDQVHP
jgi:integrase